MRVNAQTHNLDKQKTVPRRKTLPATVGQTSMKKAFIIIIKILLLPIIVVGLHFALNYNRIQIDGLDAEIYCLTHGEDTRYAYSFSHKKFRQVKVGMTEKQVLDLLGEPLTRFCYIGQEKCDAKSFFNGRYNGLKYSDSPNSENYHSRIVYVDKGIVVEVKGALWYD